ncbi:MAG: hypothetical protein JSS81_10375 [Acidobacteria bacterium]|nr:hypothetical protein [Acidobacteriota bacterium]
MQNMGGKTALGLDNNIGALLCYINVCLPIGFVYSIIVLVTDKTNKLPRFHAFQSLLLTATAIVLYIVAVIFGVVAAAAQSSIIAILASLVYVVMGLGILVAVILCAVKAFQGNIFKLPIIGGLADQWS